MKSVVSFFRNYYFVFSPFLIAIYSVLFLYVKNQHEYMLRVIWVPLGIGIVLTLILLALTKLIVRKTHASIIITATAVFICFSYGRFLELARNVSFQMGSLHVGPEIFVGVLVGAIFVLIVFLLLKFSLKLSNICKVLFVAVFALVFFQIVQIIYFQVTSGRISREEHVIAPIQTDRSKAQENYPDIYYIVPDRYAGARAFEEQYDFDNSAFLSFLKEKGFYVPENSTTNYPKTFLSLGSSLNMEYLDAVTEQTNGGKSSDESLVTPLIRNSKVLQFLKDHGYSYAHMGSWWEPTKVNDSADYIFIPRRKEHWGADEFTTGFYNTTIASELLKTFFKEPSDVSKNPQDNQHRQSALQQFEQIENIVEQEGPKFVFIHILLPHDPFVFDRDCMPISEKVVAKNSHQVNYVNQVQCANTKLMEAINTIISNSEKPPVIILQSDEGPFPMNDPIGGDQSWEKASDTALREKFPIINAYLLPDKVATTSGFYDTVTPVNSFRLLFNTYFNEDFEPLEDKNYIFKDENNYYKFIDVTDVVR